LSQESQNSGSSSNSDGALKSAQEQCLQNMEAILSQAAMGIHILFDHRVIADALKDVKDDKDFYEFDKMKKVQDILTELISKKNYFQKLAYIQSLEPNALKLVIRAYFHIIENNVLGSQLKH
jgi:hypothetical protein